MILTTGPTYTMELFLDRGAETNGCYVGLGAIELNVVPEPATASMGLVGLAALLFRCRRA
ncbi:MAG: PEP-CTERM sorting domain-containing protein [Akkermansia sp.]|nr:PEP-CTERM sorting domain-containing protein [Akkermansia sp.]